MLDSTNPEALREVAENLGPALVGTAASMLFTDGTWKKRLAQGAIGVPFSMLMAPSVYNALQNWGATSVTETGAGVLTAVFGIAGVSYVFEVWKQLHLGTLLRQWVIKKLDVEDKQSDT